MIMSMKWSDRRQHQPCVSRIGDTRLRRGVLGGDGRHFADGVGGEYHRSLYVRAYSASSASALCQSHVHRALRGCIRAISTDRSLTRPRPQWPVRHAGYGVAIDQIHIRIGGNSCDHMKQEAVHAAKVASTVRMQQTRSGSGSAASSQCFSHALRNSWPAPSSRFTVP